MGVLHSILAFLGGVPRDVFGARIDTGWGIFASLAVTVTAIVFAIAGYRSVHEFGKALDVRFDKEKIELYNRNRPDGTPPRLVNWAKARIQQVRSLRFTIPYGVLVLGTMYLWVVGYFTLRSYFILAVLWLLFAPVLRLWWIATAVWTDRKMVKTGESVHDVRRTVIANGDVVDDPTGKLTYKLYNKTVPWAVRHYLNWGLEKSTFKRPPYIGLLRPLNPFIKLFGLRWLQVRLVRPVIVCAFYACLWPLTGPIAVFYLTHELKDRGRNLLKPAWASGSAMEPTYGSGGIPDTPGDARAAFGN